MTEHIFDPFQLASSTASWAYHTVHVYYIYRGLWTMGGIFVAFRWFELEKEGESIRKYESAVGDYRWGLIRGLR